MSPNIGRNESWAVFGGPNWLYNVVWAKGSHRSRILEFTHFKFNLEFDLMDLASRIALTATSMPRI
jgi:hypothetical protein